MDFNLEEYIRSQLDELDLRGLVKDVIRTELSQQIRDELRKQVNSQTAQLVAEELSATLDKPSTVDSGWGEVTKYESLSDLFKKTLHKKISESYELKREIERMVENKVKSLFEAHKKEAVQKVAAELLSKA